MTLYLYALQYRPPGIGTCPKGWELVERPMMPGWERRMDLPESKHRFGVIGYEHPLSDEDVSRYELEPLGQAATNPRASRRRRRRTEAIFQPSRSTLLQTVWRRVYAFARRCSSRVPALSLKVGCPVIRQHRRTDERAFMHTGGAHARGQVHVAPEAADLDLNYIVGLFLHELGHPMAEKAWGRSEQEDADKAVREFLGVRLRYKGPLLLEWAPPRTVYAVMQGGRRAATIRREQGL